jgi:hypothetical protein
MTDKKIGRGSLLKQPVRKDPTPVATRSKPLEFKDKTDPYFKDNVINPNEQDDFDPNMYYFKRDKEPQPLMDSHFPPTYTQPNQDNYGNMQMPIPVVGTGSRGVVHPSTQGRFTPQPAASPVPMGQSTMHPSIGRGQMTVGPINTQPVQGQIPSSMAARQALTTSGNRIGAMNPMQQPQATRINGVVPNMGGMPNPNMRVYSQTPPPQGSIGMGFQQPEMMQMLNKSSSMVGSNYPMKVSGSLENSMNNLSLNGSSLSSKPEFQISNEDFPALSAATAYKEPSHNQPQTQPAQATEPQINIPQPHYASNSPYDMGQNFGAPQDQLRSSGSYDQYGMPHQMQAAPSSPQKKMFQQPQPHPSQPQQPYDPYRMLGLLKVLKMQDPDLNTLALGADLTSLGLNLSSPDVLYATFASPFADAALRREPEFHIPNCYVITPPLPPPTDKMSLLMDETLFYIFYTMPNDPLQSSAAVELYNRDWRYHKELQIWFRRMPGTEPIVKTQTYERGSYIYFDIGTWEKMRKDNFVLEYDKLEIMAKS